MGLSFIQNNPLLPVAISLMLGIMAGFSFPILHWPLYVPLVLFFLFVLAALFAKKYPILQTSFILMSIAVAGLFLSLRQQQSLLRHRYDHHPRIIKAVVASEPAEKEKTVGLDIILTPNGRKVKCYVEKDERSRRLKPGDGLLMKTRINPCAEKLGKSFNYRQYMERNGFSGQCYVKAGHWQKKKALTKELPAMVRTRIACLKIRHSLLEEYRLLGADEDRYAVLAAMTLGDKSALSPTIRDIYAVTGASHILALSGMHLGILYMLLSLLTFSRGRHRILTQAILITAVWAFALLTGLSVSVVRSALMISIFAVFAVGFRFNASLNLLSLSAIIILAVNPYALFDVGFQLSFMAVLGILLFVPLMGGRNHYRIVNILTDCLRVSAAAQLGVAPLLAFYFGRFSTYFLLTNLIVLPAAYLILYGSLLMLLVPWPPLAAAVIGVVDLMNRILAQMNRWPLASIEGLHPSVLQVLFCYLAIACLLGILIVWSGKRPKNTIRWDN